MHYQIDNEPFKLCGDPHDTHELSRWASFFLVRNPGIDGAKWPVFTPEQQEYVTLNINPPQQKTMMKAKECRLWNKLLPEIQKVSGETYIHTHTHLSASRIFLDTHTYTCTFTHTQNSL